MFSVSEAQQVDETGGGNADVADAVTTHEQQKSQMLKAQLGGFGSSKSLNKSLGRSTGSRTQNRSRKGSNRESKSKGQGSGRKKKGGSSRASSKRDLLDAAINSYSN